LRWSARRIARHLGIDRGTVRKYLRRANCGSKPAIPPAGSEGLPPPDTQSTPATSSPPIKRGRPSECELFQPLILKKLQQELSAQRIYQNLTVEHGFTGSYDSVKRFVRQLGHSRALPMRRMECGAGEEAQVDFGSGAPVIGPDGKRRRTHVFRIVLSHSRKAYSEAMLVAHGIEGACHASSSKHS
jgi:transposase